MRKDNLRGLINMLNLKAEELNLNDIQVSQVPMSQMNLDDTVVEIEGADTVYIVISEKTQFPTYPPVGEQVSFGIKDDASVRLAYEKAFGALLGIWFSRVIADKTPRPSEKTVADHLTSTVLRY